MYFTVCMFRLNYLFYNVNLLRGMRVSSGKLTIHKDEGNMIGISIGGGAPLCPCLYIVQVHRLIDRQINTQ